MEHEYEDEYDEDGNSRGIDISEFIGKTFTQITGANPDSLNIRFVAKDTAYNMYHVSDCCEYVRLIDVCGDIEDLINTPIVNAYMESNTTDPVLQDSDECRCLDDSHTWTFYRLATIKGTVTLRWLGESNGYYSEEVSIFRVNNATPN